MPEFDLQALENTVLEFCKSADGQRILGYAVGGLLALLVFHKTVEAMKTPAKIAAGMGKAGWWATSGLFNLVFGVTGSTFGGLAAVGRYLFSRQPSEFGQQILTAMAHSTRKRVDDKLLAGNMRFKSDDRVGVIAVIGDQGVTELLTPRDRKKIGRKVKEYLGELQRQEDAVMRQLVIEQIRFGPDHRKPVEASPYDTMRAAIAKRGGLGDAPGRQRTIHTTDCQASNGAAVTYDNYDPT